MRVKITTKGEEVKKKLKMCIKKLKECMVILWVRINAESHSPFRFAPIIVVRYIVDGIEEQKKKNKIKSTGMYV